MIVLCWKCKKEAAETGVKIGFRATCPHCDADLHACTACRYYSPGKPNDCLVPGTDYVRDREANNLCEDFKPQTNFDQGSDTKKNRAKFNSLFKDDD